MENKKQIPWYKRKELWGTALTLLSFSPELINSVVDAGIIPEYTLIAKLATPIGIILTVLGLRKGYNAKNLIFQNNSKLPEGLRKNPFK